MTLNARIGCRYDPDRQLLMLGNAGRHYLMPENMANFENITKNYKTTFSKSQNIHGYLLRSP